MPASSPQSHGLPPTPGEPAIGALPPKPGGITLWVSPVRQIPRWVRALGLLWVTLGLAGAIALTGGGFWLGFSLMLRPHPPSWLLRWLPQTTTDWGTAPPQSLAAIEGALQQQGLVAGTLLELAAVSDNPAMAGLWLLPVFSVRSPCSAHCDTLVELRLYGQYRQTGTVPHLQLLDQHPIQGVPKAQVLESISRAGLERAFTSQRLPLQNLQPLPHPGLPGAWLTVTGRWQGSGVPILYGQIVYIDPQALRVHALLPWSSPPRRLPRWLNGDSQGLPELLVDQQVGLEPQFGLYTVEGTGSPLRAPHLTAVDLTPVPLPPPHEAPYDGALYLAQQGLWSVAQQRLTTLKAAVGDRWPIQAERQLQWVTLHAQVTQAQASHTWSQPNHQLLALLIDGQWETALSWVQSPEAQGSRNLIAVFSGNSNRLWQRVTATLRLFPDQGAARLWGALILTAQENPEAARRWLRETQQPPSLVQRYETLLALFQPAAPPIALTPSPQDPAPEAATAIASGLLGTVTSLGSPDLTAWHHPPGSPPLALAPGQQWYQITLQGGWVGDRWSDPLPLPVEATPAALQQVWQGLSLGETPTLQVLGSTTPANAEVAVQVQGIQRQGTEWQLLAAGPSLPSGGDPHFAVTPGQFVRPAIGTVSSLGDVRQRQPAVGDRLLLSVATQLSAEDSVPTNPVLGGTGASEDSPLAAVSVHLYDLTQDGQAEFIVFLPPGFPTTPSGMSRDRPGVAIFHPDGQLLYSTRDRGEGDLLGWLFNPQGAAGLLLQRGDRLTVVPLRSQY